MQSCDRCVVGFGESESSESLSKSSSPQVSPVRIAPSAPAIPIVTSSPEEQRRRKLERDETEKLRRQIEAYKDIIEQQETFIQVTSQILTSDVTNLYNHVVGLQAQMERVGRQNGDVSTSALHTSGVWEEQRRLDAKEELLAEQQKNFEAERKQVADAAMALAQEVRVTKSYLSTLMLLMMLF